MTKSESDYKKIIEYKKKNGGTLSMAAQKTGAKLANYAYWRNQQKKRNKPKGPAAPTVLERIRARQPLITGVELAELIELIRVAPSLAIRILGG